MNHQRSSSYFYSGSLLVLYTMLWLAACFFLLWPEILPARQLDLNQLVADSLYIELPQGSSGVMESDMPRVEDHRELSSRVLGVREIKKWGVIPVDQFLVLHRPLKNVLEEYLSEIPDAAHETLVIEHLSFWHDSAPWFEKGWVLNGATRLLGSAGDTLSTWQWEYRLKQRRRQDIAGVISALTMEWLIGQRNALTRQNFYPAPRRYRYRRQLIFWMDTIMVPDGYILDGRLSLYYPADQVRRYYRGIPGIYYRQSPLHESIAIGGKDQQWYFRFSPSFLARLDVTGWIGFNRFNEQAFDYVDWWNILLVNLGMTAAVEFRPIYHRGLYAGLGFYQSLNILPEIIDRYTPGLLLTVGVQLP